MRRRGEKLAVSDDGGDVDGNDVEGDEDRDGVATVSNRPR